MVEFESFYDCIRKMPSVLLIMLITLAFAGDVLGQETGKYLLGDDQKLEMIVHVLGEVQRPGEYRVADNTNVLELISKAGGPTEFSNLGSTTITRVSDRALASGGNGHGNNGHLNAENQIIKVNLSDYLKKANAPPLPLLQPSDVVLIPRNSWSKWRNTFAIVRDISVVVSVYLLYLRVENGN